MEGVECIYLKPGIYKDNNIIIEKNITIKSYENDVIFTGTDNKDVIIFNTMDNNNITLEGLNFLKNQCKYIINNSAKLNIKNSILLANFLKGLYNKGNTIHI